MHYRLQNNDVIHITGCIFKLALSSITTPSFFPYLMVFFHSVDYTSATTILVVSIFIYIYICMCACMSLSWVCIELCLVFTISHILLFCNFFYLPYFPNLEEKNTILSYLPWTFCYEDPSFLYKKKYIVNMITNCYFCEYVLMLWLGRESLLSLRKTVSY